MKKFKKKLGQNFLIDNNIKNKLINSIKIKNTDIIIEIGSGEGSLSKEISSLSKKSHFIEIEKHYIPKLKEHINELKSQIHHDNILNFNIKDIIKKYKKIRIIGNLPYKIATQILIKLTNFSKKIKDIHFVVQKELADKISIQKENKKYGRLSITMQHHFDIEKLFDIKSQAFHPPPKVTSSLIRLTPKIQKTKIKNEKIFNKIVTQAFNNKRKKMCNSLTEIKNIGLISILDKRPTNMSYEDFANIYNNIYNKTEDYKNI